MNYNGDDSLYIQILLLEKQVGDLASQLSLAYEYIATDPKSSLTKSRIVLENLLVKVYKTELGLAPRKKMIGSILNEKEFKDKLPKRIVALANTIREFCNLGPHPAEVKVEDAERALKDLIDVLSWYRDTYIVSVSGSSILTKRSVNIKLAQERILSGHTNWVWDVAFAPKGPFLVSASTDKTVRVWDYLTGTEMRQLPFDFDNNEKLCLAFNPNGRFLAAGGFKGIIYLWRGTTGRGERIFQETRRWGSRDPIAEIVFDNRRLISVNHKGVVVFWDIAQEEIVKRLEGFDLATINPDRTLIASRVVEGTDSFGRVATGRAVVNSVAKGIDVSNLDNGEILYSLRDMEVVSQLRFSYDGQLLAAGDTDGVVQLWEAESGKPLHWLEGHKDAVSCLAFSPSGDILVSGGSRDQTLILWDVVRGQEIQTIKLSHQPLSLAFSADGNYLAVGEGYDSKDAFDYGLASNIYVWKLER